MNDYEVIKSFTARYSPREDRIYLDCCLDDNKKLRLYLTQRMLNAVVIELSRRLEERSAEHRFEALRQQAALQKKEKSKSIKIHSHEAVTWLITRILVKTRANSWNITFSQDRSHAAQLIVNDDNLRIFLDIIMRTFLRAHWPVNNFPTWLNKHGGSHIPKGLMH